MSRVASRRITKQERVYTAIRERIVAGTYGAGRRVLIGDVALEFGVSHLPVREALRRLQAEGLLVYRPNAGAHVAEDAPLEFDQTFRVFAVLDGYATMLAAPLMTASKLEALSTLNERIADTLTLPGSVGFGRLDGEFHALIHEVCPNKALSGIAQASVGKLEALWNFVLRVAPQRGVECLAEHRELIRAIRRNEPADQLEIAARTHNLKTVESLAAREQNTVATMKPRAVPTPT